MTSILIAYASTHGHTAKICRRIADHLQAANLDVDLRDLGAGDDDDPITHDAVIAAASVHRGTYQPEVIRWAKRHSSSLAVKPTAFVSVCLSAAEDTDESRDFVDGLFHDLTVETGWKPGREVSFAGALQYREYDFFTRTLMRLLMRRGGHPTDTSRDYDYTDWRAVERFADEFAASVASAAATGR